jgi:hypothetical protein
MSYDYQQSSYLKHLQEHSYIYEEWEGLRFHPLEQTRRDGDEWGQ